MEIPKLLEKNDNDQQDNNAGKECQNIFENKDEHQKKYPDHKIKEIPMNDQLQHMKFMQKIGQGSYGVIFKVTDNSDKLIKALKIIEESEKDGDIDILPKLYHQNIARYFRSGKLDQDRAFVLMELCTHDLKKYLKLRLLKSYKEKINCFWQICKGLQYLHEVIYS